jgi:hypothetical protein
MESGQLAAPSDFSDVRAEYWLRLVNNDPHIGEAQNTGVVEM